MKTELETVCENFLVDNLDAGLKASLDDLIAGGEPVMKVYRFVERTIRQQYTGPERDPITLLQVEAYFDRRYGTTFAQDRQADQLGIPRGERP